MDITSEQLRAARALLRLEQSELARRAHVSIVAMRRLEETEGRKWAASATLAGVKHALEQAGVEFVPGGVRRHTVPSHDANTLYENLRAISLRSAAALSSFRLLDQRGDFAVGWSRRFGWMGHGWEVSGGGE